MTTLADTARRLRAEAEAGPIGKRQSSMELYALLAGCMALAERCRGGAERHEMRALVAQQPATGNRRYVEKSADEYSLVCRFVFHGLRSSSAERSNASRYAHALRRAHARGISSADLAAYLWDNGGVNALFLARPLDAVSVTTKCLNLTRSIEVPKRGPITITLTRCPDGRFDPDPSPP